MQPTVEWCIEHERHEPIPACAIDPDMYESDIQDEEDEEDEDYIQDYWVD